MISHRWTTAPSDADAEDVGGFPARGEDFAVPGMTVANGRPPSSVLRRAMSMVRWMKSIGRCWRLRARTRCGRGRSKRARPRTSGSARPRCTRWPPRAGPGRCGSPPSGPGPFRGGGCGPRSRCGCAPRAGRFPRRRPARIRRRARTGSPGPTTPPRTPVVGLSPSTVPGRARGVQDRAPMITIGGAHGGPVGSELRHLRYFLAVAEHAGAEIMIFVTCSDRCGDQRPSPRVRGVGDSQFTEAGAVTAASDPEARAPAERSAERSFP